MKVGRRKTWLGIIGFVLLYMTGCSTSSEAGDKPEEIRLDYAYYSPTSLVLKEFGWLEEAFADEDIEIEWALSQGSNKALEFLNSDSVDFGSAAGAATLLSKTNGAPIKNVYIFSNPEWTALVANEESGIEAVEDLKGKKVAATLGTDPHIFLLRALNEANLSVADLEIVNMQHGDGASSLLSGSVDAWAGLDPHMARLELESDAALFYREIDFNTYGFLNVREEFAEDYPAYVERVIDVYERAREWTEENPRETAEILAKEAGIPMEVAEKQLERTDYANPIPGEDHEQALIEAGKVLQAGEVIDEQVELEELISDLIEPQFAEEIIKEETKGE